MSSKLPQFASFRDVQLWESVIEKKLSPLESNVADYLKYWYQESQENSHAYPSQGMLLTPFDNLPYSGKGMVPPRKMLKILRVRQYFLELFNHPQRIKHLKKINNAPFVAPQKVSSQIMNTMITDEVALAIADLGISVVGSQGNRVSRTVRLEQGPFIKLGKRARSVLVGSAMPDIWGSVSAISTMAQCLSLVGVPRNGPFSEVHQQLDLVKQVWHALETSEVLIGRTKKEKEFLLDTWKHNVMGVIEAEAKGALKRAEFLYDVGVRVFRVYSPEPGLGPLETVKALRKKYGDAIEIFVGQVVDVQQAKQLEDAGADAIYVGIGGGGRCITGVRSGSVIDWPQLVWKLRGEIGIPIVVEGGASDHIATSLSLGVSGIGVSRIAGGGTVESPGGMLYCIDDKGRYFKPYGGEASARTKYLDNKMLPFGLPSFVEGEVRTAHMSYLDYGVPTLAYNVFSLIEDVILSLVFRGAENIYDLHALDPSPLRRKTSLGSSIQQTH